MILPIVAYGANILRQPCEIITPATPGITALIRDMWATLEHANGAGLAAPQVNRPVRLFVVPADDFKITFINPEILWYSEEVIHDTEGCLSIPGIWEDVPRAATVTLQYQDEHFTTHTASFSGDIARAIQHEYDHINGKLYLDYLSPLKKSLLKNKLKAIAKGKVKTPYPMKTS
ncbi:peptide deformylase [Chitinophaga sp.]|uniref:peptide deformylase n=1 Tax=Chitinophaga sp. TaxID=1869181 RepID=UPI002CDC08EE|nr:peptide deformylase [Chitinophaga sp.]HWV66892.1 peptide deformylase [Chitinophaga sp.]